jgi:hypothetical protein
MVSQIIVDDVKSLGERMFAVRLTARTPMGDTALSRTQTVRADEPEAAVRIAKEEFSRWLKKVARVALQITPPTPPN